MYFKALNLKQNEQPSDKVAIFSFNEPPYLIDSYKTYLFIQFVFVYIYLYTYLFKVYQCVHVCLYVCVSLCVYVCSYVCCFHISLIPGKIGSSEGRECVLCRSRVLIILCSSSYLSLSLSLFLFFFLSLSLSFIPRSPHFPKVYIIYKSG